LSWRWYSRYFSLGQREKTDPGNDLSGCEIKRLREKVARMERILDEK
jgi:hypothetical protein